MLLQLPALRTTWRLGVGFPRPQALAVTPCPLIPHWSVSAIQGWGWAEGQQERLLPHMVLCHTPCGALDEPRSHIPSPEHASPNTWAIAMVMVPKSPVGSPTPPWDLGQRSLTVIPVHQLLLHAHGLSDHLRCPA